MYIYNLNIGRCSCSFFSRKSNKHVHQGISKEEFVKMREERDATLDHPKLLIPSVQVHKHKWNHS